MAKRRMLSVDLISSDAFCVLSSSVQMLYLHLNMNADDDGVVDKWKAILRYLRVKQNHLDSLINAGYIIELECGALLIADWLIHNKIRKDRYTPSKYLDELESMEITIAGRYIKG